ncbi:hypothetical protein NL676_011019 [Syzygium grande]|nr:hypothetical protein NL676_011019 [Syzygium grande]
MTSKTCLLTATGTYATRAQHTVNTHANRRSSKELDNKAKKTKKKKKKKKAKKKNRQRDFRAWSKRIASHRQDRVVLR